MSENAPARARTGFFDGLIDGMLARRLWDPPTARARKSLNYVLGELWATATQPLALFCAWLDWQTIEPNGV